MSFLSTIMEMVKFQSIVEQNENAYRRTIKMKPKVYTPETYIKCITAVCKKQIQVEHHIRISKKQSFYKMSCI